MNLNKPNKTDFKRKSLILIIVYLVLTTVVFYFLVNPAIEDVKSLRLEILSKKIDIEKNINKEINKSELGAKLRKIEADIEKFNKIFINKDRDLEFITTLEGIADENNISQYISINTSTYNNENAYNIIPITLNATGNFENSMEYLKKLETSMYYIKITSLSLEKLEAADSQSKVKLNIGADTYWK